MFYKLGVLKNFAKLTGIHLLRSLFLIKSLFFSQVFSREFCEIFKTPFLQDTSGRLLLLNVTNDKTIAVNKIYN